MNPLMRNLIYSLPRSAWSPQPELEQMRGFPQSMIETASDPKFWEKAKNLLHVTPANEIDDDVFGEMQDDIDTKLQENYPLIYGATGAEPGPLAVGRVTPTSTLSFVKFSTPGPLLALQEKQMRLADKKKGSPLMIATDVVVKNLIASEEIGKAVALQTSQGDIAFPKGNTNIILAMGAIPATTLLLNSLESMQNRAGKRLTGHFLTHIAARFPIDLERFPQLSKCTKENCEGECRQKLEIAASYLAGEDPDTMMQYHVQITAIHSPHPEWDAVDAARECPDYAAAATEEQLEGSQNYIVLSRSRPPYFSTGTRISCSC